MFHAFLRGVNLKKLMLAMLGVFVFKFLSDWLIHGQLLMETYQQTASLWRPEQEMQGNMIWMLLAKLIYAKYFCYLFAKGYENKGWGEGVRFGLVAGLFLCSHSFVQYATTPMPLSLLACWVVADLVQAILSGVIAAKIYKK